MSEPILNYVFPNYFSNFTSSLEFKFICVYKASKLFDLNAYALQFQLGIKIKAAKSSYLFSPHALNQIKMEIIIWKITSITYKQSHANRQNPKLYRYEDRPTGTSKSWIRLNHGYKLVITSCTLALCCFSMSNKDVMFTDKPRYAFCFPPLPKIKPACCYKCENLSTINVAQSQICCDFSEFDRVQHCQDWWIIVLLHPLGSLQKSMQTVIECFKRYDAFFKVHNIELESCSSEKVLWNDKSWSRFHSKTFN